MSTSPSVSQPWWQTAVVYQVYPRSFQDSGQDGVGDLPGLIQRLDYLAWLGVDALWISPFYPSPMEDFGYDITDYCGVDPLFGTLADFDALVARAHALGLRIILDFVPNHTSWQHPWFQAAHSSREHPQRDWYLWQDPSPSGGPPNNWRSVTGRSAWTLDAKSGQCYLHSFLPQQPDLNWRHPAVRAALFDAMRFWLKRGVDGLRVDMVDFLVKDELLRDEPDPEYVFPEAQYHLNRPETLDLLLELRAVTDEFPDRVLIGEIVPHLPVAQVLPYYGPAGERLHLPFNFALLDAAFTAPGLRRVIGAYDGALPPHAWPNYTLGNHDQPRLASRFGSAGARLAALLLLTLRGTPFLYYGDELGLPDTPVPGTQMQDPWEQVQPGAGRDPERAPMPWDASLTGGFSPAPPWLPLAPGHEHLSVETQRQDPASLLCLYRELLRLRRSHPALLQGEFQWHANSPDDVLAYIRAGTEPVLIALNFSQHPQHLDLPAGNWHSLVSTVTQDFPNSERSLTLRPFEGRLLGRATPE
ncbi:alpha-amylase family glycosyl hydrolase [Deinococcus sp. QL22]|uniref:alpha-amylase family glycosyl hydrolase n=1 Tax=Deinococcus sp. QL22 TaxID=2939437 RepID=UPI002017F034|nr:alpha-amylase family glycosyl hydrolase [Deinococcus sp. QL22]UQN08089.1 alpha-amylase family glycosyl hydrolase [Deinococcus sp. QL22]